MVEFPAPIAVDLSGVALTLDFAEWMSREEFAEMEAMGDPVAPLAFVLTLAARRAGVWVTEDEARRAVSDAFASLIAESQAHG